MKASIWLCTFPFVRSHLIVITFDVYASDLDVEEWSKADENGTKFRTLRFMLPLSYPIGPKATSCVEEQVRYVTPHSTRKLLSTR